MTWWDHVYAAGVLPIALLLGGAWAYRRFVARPQRHGEDKLVRGYKLTLLWFAGLVGAAVLVSRRRDASRIKIYGALRRFMPATARHISGLSAAEAAGAPASA